MSKVFMVHTRASPRLTPCAPVRRLHVAVQYHASVATSNMLQYSYNNACAIVATACMLQYSYNATCHFGYRLHVGTFMQYSVCHFSYRLHVAIFIQCRVCHASMATSYMFQYNTACANVATAYILQIHTMPRVPWQYGYLFVCACVSRAIMPDFKTMVAKKNEAGGR